jgi:hypothetical protein
MTATSLRDPSTASRRLGAGLVVLAMAMAACSSAGSSPSAAAPSSAPTTAASSGTAAAPSGSLNGAAEVDAVIAGLNKANDLYKAGQVQQAMDEIAETYEEHFELIEGPLEARDNDLKEDLEQTIASEIRAQMQANKPAADVDTLIKATIVKLQTAKALLA